MKGIWIISVLVSILVLGGFAYVHYAEADFRVFTQANIEHVRDPNLLYIMLRNNGPSFYFVPTDIRIVVGDTITFSNHDVVAHELEIHVHDGTIVRSEGSSTSLFNDDNHDNYFTNQFEVNTAEGKDVTRYQLDAMQSFSYTFSSVGTYDVIDPNHQDVVGRIVVLDEENEDTNRDYVFSQTFNKMMDQMMGHTTSHEEDDHVDKAERKFLKKDTCKEALKQQEKLAEKGKQSDLIDDFIIKEECSTDEERDDKDDEERDDKDDEERDDKDDEERDDKDDEEPPVPPVPPGPPLPDPADVCSAAADPVSYTILAINVDITINRFGDHDPSGMMYVLEENLDAVRAQETSPLPRVSTGLGDDPIQPLVIRANLGDCVKVIFKNQLKSESASIHFHKVAVLPAGDGSAVGNNPDSTIAPGETITYTVFLEPKPELEGAAYFHSHGDNARQQVAHGLFGALIAEPEGSVFLHPETGLPIKSGWEAMIVGSADPLIKDFREFAVVYHEIGDEEFEVLDKDDDELPEVGEILEIYRPCSKALNYRSECFENRLNLVVDDSLGYSSYFFGDPATPIPRSYVGDPAKTRLIHGGSEMFHVHHLHGGAVRWQSEPIAGDRMFMYRDLDKFPDKSPPVNLESARLDVQTIGPSEVFNLEHECGSGGCQGAAGDFLFHCHIPHHYLGGMWSFWRVFNTIQDIEELPDREGFIDDPVNSLELLGKELPSGRILTEDNIEEWIENLLPPQGVPGEYDATVWDWVKETREVEDPLDMTMTIQAPLYFTEPEDTTIWANFASATPGERREILFDPETGRFAHPLFSPHLGMRPPFAPGAHGPAPYLSTQEDANSMPTNLILADLFTEPLTPRDPETPIRDSKWLPICPEGSPIKRYNVVAITLTIAYNTFGDKDKDGQIFVLAEDVDDVLSGKKPAEPLALRANVGDCIQYTLTSKLVDFEENHDFSKVNYHHHLMQFDPLASDGVISGFGYEQSVRPFATEDVNLDREAKEGDLQIIVNDGSKFKNGIWIAIAMGTNDIELHRIAEISSNKKTITLTEPLVRDHPLGEAVGVEFVRQAFYADANVGVVYNHDHVAGHVSWGHGLFGAIIIEPKDSTYHDPSTGERVRSGAIVDIHTNDRVAIDRPGESFREMTLWIQDAAAPIEGVGEPEVGGGGSSFNLRAESFEGRLDNNPDSSLLFSSVTHGDPATPIFRAYEEDPLVIRLLQGASNEVHIFRIMDHRFNLERFPGAAVIDSLHIGIAEQFNIFLEDAAGNPGAGKAGDYLYYDPDAFRFAEGMWGILRVHDTLQDSLEVLPGRTPPPEGPGFPELTQTGGRPPEPPDAGEPCPAGAPLREFDVVAMPANIVFNERIGIDNNGKIFALAADVPGILSGAKVDPLVLRGNAGDCIEVTLTNNLDSRVSMHLGKLLADPQRSLGITLGFNFDQSVLPGEWITYRVYADRELGAGIIADFANDISGMEEGLYGAIIIGPENSNYFDPETGSEISAGWQAMVTNDDPSIETYKDFVLIFQEQDPIIGRNLMPYPSETEGISAINYRTEPLEKRKEPVLSSLVNGDPETPLMMATLGEPVKIHVLQGFGHQVHVFGLNGHYWSFDPNIPGANILSSRAIGPHESMDISLVGGAGGTQQGVGDYLYLNHRMPFFEGGQWGILRVMPP